MRDLVVLVVRGGVVYGAEGYAPGQSNVVAVLDDGDERRCLGRLAAAAQEAAENPPSSRTCRTVQQIRG